MARYSDSDSDSDSDSNFEEYEVEKIISCKLTNNGTLSYLVRWKSYGESDDTWEPEENLRGCKDAIVKFFKERDTHAEVKKRYSILHLRQNSPSQSVSSKSSYGTPRKRTMLQTRKPMLSNQKRINTDQKESDELSSLLNSVSPSNIKLRMTPERQRFLFEQINKFKARQLFEGSKGNMVVQDDSSTNDNLKTKNHRVLSLKSSPVKKILRSSGMREEKPESNVFYKFLFTVALCLLVVFVFCIILVYDLS